MLILSDHNSANELQDPTRQEKQTVTHRETRAAATYRIAAITAGYAWQCSLELATGAGSHTTWQGPEPTREAAINAIRSHAQNKARHWPDMAPIAHELIAHLDQPDLGIEAP